MQMWWIEKRGEKSTEDNDIEDRSKKRSRGGKTEERGNGSVVEWEKRGRKGSKIRRRDA